MAAAWHIIASAAAYQRQATINGEIINGSLASAAARSMQRQRSGGNTSA